MTLPKPHSDKTPAPIPRESMRQLARELAPLIIDEMRQLGMLQRAALHLQDDEGIPPCSNANQSMDRTHTATDGASRSTSPSAADARNAVEHLRRRMKREPSNKP